MYFDFPIIPAFPWLKIDLSEVPALMGGFAYGPITGGIIVILKVFLRFLIKGTETGFVGETANIIIGLALVVPAAWLYNRNKSKKTAIVGMVIGALVMQVLGIVANARSSFTKLYILRISTFQWCKSFNSVYSNIFII